MTDLTDAQLFVPLKTTLVPTNGSGNPTATRASTKTVEDNEGKVKTLKSGAVAMAGARVVQNWCRLKSEDLTSAAWVKFGVTASAQVMVSSAATTTMYCNNDMGGALIESIGESWLASFRVQYVDIQYVQLCGHSTAFGSGPLCNFDLVNGDYTATSCTGTMTVVSAGVFDISVKFTSVARGNVPLIFLALVPSQTATRVQPFVGDGIKSLGVLRFQLQNVTHSDIVAGPYVSVGVLSAPYHGGGTDGVKYFATDSSGVAITDATMLGAHIDPASKTNTMLWCRDLTNAAWVKTNCTPLKNQTGVDGLANACSLLTAAAADATILQTITTVATAACTGWKVKRVTGTGSIYITRDGGSNWTDITSLINSSTFTLVGIENTSVTNPQVGFKIATSGDEFIIDSGRNHSGKQLCEDIFTTAAAVTRSPESLTYQTASNFSDTAGTILATFRPTYDTWPAGSIVGKASFGLLASTTNSGVQAADGTNTINGAAGSTLAGRKIGMKWSGSALKAFAGGTFGTAGSYDGAFNLTTVGINTGAAGYIRDVAIWTSSLSDADMLSAACDKADFTSAIACTAVMLDVVIYASVMSSAVDCTVVMSNNITNTSAMSSAVACDAEIFNNIINSVYMSSEISIESIFDAILGTSAENITIRASATYSNVARNGTYSSMQINADYP